MSKSFFFCFYLTVSVELIILSLFFGLGDISGRVFTSSRCVNAIFTVISFYYLDKSVLLENIPLVKFIKTTSGTRVVYFP